MSMGAANAAGADAIGGGGIFTGIFIVWVIWMSRHWIKGLFK